VLGGVPLTINPQTGLLTATPNTLGYFVYGVKCKEYRNGVLLSETLRDFQLIVKDCPSLVVASAAVPSVFCGSNTVSFTNGSVGASSYSWYFGDPTTTADSSNLFNPSYTYPATGTYTVTMVAYAPGNPLCNDTAVATLNLSDNFSGTFTMSSEPCDPTKVYFNSTVNAPAGMTVYEWNFGDTVVSAVDGTIITSGNTNGPISDPVHTYPNVPANYSVSLVIYIPGNPNCRDTLVTQVINIGQGGHFFIPNTFTPNGDGKNDIFRVRGPQYTKFYLAVYNRWGQMVYETTNPNDGWDGIYNGMPADPGVFGYYVRAACGEGKEETFKKGNVTLIR
jgi:gliding motility-associated-like protein